MEGITENLEIRAKKDLRFGDLRVLKGIKSSATELAPGLYEQWHFSTIRYGFMARSLDGVTLRRVQKQLRYGRIAGTISDDGRVTPPHLRLDTNALAGYLVDTQQECVWVWEFEAEYLRQVGLWARLRKRVTYQLRPFSPPAPPPPPPPRELEPLVTAPLAF
ncbi:hypothetical protein ES708_27452 [subsurface metagenome]